MTAMHENNALVLDALEDAHDVLATLTDGHSDGMGGPCPCTHCNDRQPRLRRALAVMRRRCRQSPKKEVTHA